MYEITKARMLLTTAAFAAVAAVLSGAFASPGLGGELWLEEAGIGGGAGATGTVVKFVASPGETNDVTISTSGRGVSVADLGAPVTALWGPWAAAGCWNGFDPNVGNCDPNHARIVRVDVLLGDDDDRVVVNARVPTTLNGEAGADRLTGGPSRDVLLGGWGSDVLDGAGDCDALFGQGAKDRLDGGTGADVLDGGGGNDVADYSKRTSTSSNTIQVTLDGPARGGTVCAPIVTPPGERPLPRLLIGNDDGNRGMSPYEGDNVHANVEGVLGGAGPDLLVGNEADNRLEGGDGQDYLRGGNGRDQLYGGADDDMELNGGLGADLISGGAGSDLASYSGHPSGVNVTLDGLENDGAALEGDNVSIDIEDVTGTRYADTLIGSDSDNILRGEYGDDVYFGGGGADQMIDGDSIDPEGGADTFDARDGGVSDTIVCGADFDADDLDEFDFVFYEVLANGSQNDQLAGSCDDAMFTILP